MSKWVPHQHRILVKVDEVEEKSAGGIILTGDVKEREQTAQVLATVVEVGPTAEVDEGIRAGTRVMIAKWGGAAIPGEDFLRVINDEDINAICV